MRPFLLAALALAFPVAAQTTQTVTTTADSGAGSLRSAIAAINGAGGGRIEFAIPGDGPHVIRPTLNLPPITVPVEIDGLTQPGASCDPWPPTLLIEISGSDIDREAQQEGGFGLHLLGGGSVVRGLSIHDFLAYYSPQTGGRAAQPLRLAGDGNRVECNYIGLPTTGDRARSLGGVISQGHDTVIGGAGPGTRNVIAGHDVDLQLYGDRSRIVGNYFGIDPTGTARLPRDDAEGTLDVSLILISGDDTVFGEPGAGNVVVGRVHLSGGRPLVQGNRLATTADGSTAFVEEDTALGVIDVSVSASSPPIEGALIGGGEPGSGNVVNGLIQAQNVTGLRVVGNSVGVSEAGTEFFPHGLIQLRDASEAVVGGASASERNVVSGSIELIRATDSVVQGNHVGVDATGGTANEDAGPISVGSESAGNLIGGTGPGEGNVAAGGVHLLGSTGNRVVGNRIGTTASGTEAIGSPFYGVWVRRADGNQIGGAAPGEGNVIAALPWGVHISEATRNEVLGNRIGVGLDGTPLEGIRRGVYLSGASETVVGSADAPNRIRYANDAGVVVTGAGDGSDQNAVSGNLIYGVGGMAIDLIATGESGVDGLNTNDPGDADEGPNRLQNAPEVATASATDAAVAVTYAVDTAPANAAYPLRVEAFAVSSSDAVYLGHDEIPEAEAGTAREATFSLAAPLGGGASLVLVATDADGNTGESSLPAALTPSTAANDAPKIPPFAVAAWPNPTAGRLAVAVVGTRGEPVRVAVVDALGRQVARAESARSELDLSGLAPGVYVVRVESGGRVAAQSLAIVR